VTRSVADRALSRVRSLCLALPETSETGSFGHPNFRAGKRTFVTFEWVETRPSIAFRLGADAVDALLLGDRRFFASPYGRGQWASLHVDGSVDWLLVETLVERAYRSVALKRMLAALAG